MLRKFYCILILGKFCKMGAMAWKIWALLPLGKISADGRAS